MYLVHMKMCLIYLSIYPSIFFLQSCVIACGLQAFLSVGTIKLKPMRGPFRHLVSANLDQIAACWACLVSCSQSRWRPLRAGRVPKQISECQLSILAPLCWFDFALYPLRLWEEVGHMEASEPNRCRTPSPPRDGIHKFKLKRWVVWAL